MLDVSFRSEIDLFRHLPDSCLEALEKNSHVLNCSTGHLFFQPARLSRLPVGSMASRIEGRFAQYIMRRLCILSIPLESIILAKDGREVQWRTRVLIRLGTSP